VPFLAPCYYALGIVLARYPRYRVDFCLLSAWGLVLMGLAWRAGPWTGHLVPGFWFVLAMALASWAWFAWRRWGASAISVSESVDASLTAIIAARVERPELPRRDPLVPHQPVTPPAMDKAQHGHD
jgi:hypothetical protein